MTATAQQLQFIKDSIKTIPDYPKPGILFRDVTSLLENPLAYAASNRNGVVGNNGNTTPSVASTTASQPRIINNQRVMSLLHPWTCWRLLYHRHLPHRQPLQPEYARGACFTA